MPVYPYKCLTCGNSEDILHPMSGKPGVCGECGEDTLQRDYSVRTVAVTKRASKTRDHKKSLETSIHKMKEALEEQKRILQDERGEE